MASRAGYPGCPACCSHLHPLRAGKLRSKMHALSCEQATGVHIEGRAPVPWCKEHSQQGQVARLTSVLLAVGLRSVQVAQDQGQQPQRSLVVAHLLAPCASEGSEGDAGVPRCLLHSQGGHKLLRLLNL